LVSIKKKLLHSKGAFSIANKTINAADCSWLMTQLFVQKTGAKEANKKTQRSNKTATITISHHPKKRKLPAICR
jgi:hypothetical protein